MPTDIKIKVRSNIFPEVTVYDSASKPGIISKALELGYSVDVNGNTVYASKSQPDVNPVIKWVVAFGIIGGAGFALWRIIR